MGLVLGLAALAWTLAMAANEKSEKQRPSVVRAYRLKRLDAEVAAEILKEVCRDKDARITVDKHKNAIIVDASQETQTIIADTLREWDVKEIGPRYAKPPTPPEDEINKMTERELRDFVFTLSKQVKSLQKRVAQLEEKTSLRMMPIDRP